MSGLDYRIAKLNLHPDDVLVLKCDRVISDHEANRLRKCLAAVLPEDAKIVVLDKWSDLAVIKGDTSTNSVSIEET